jgi:hypothetical protein
MSNGTELTNMLVMLQRHVAARDSEKGGVQVAGGGGGGARPLLGLYQHAGSGDV